MGLIDALMLQREAGVVLMMRASSGQHCALFCPSAFSAHSLSVLREKYQWVKLCTAVRAIPPREESERERREREREREREERASEREISRRTKRWSHNITKRNHQERWSKWSWTAIGGTTSDKRSSANVIWVFTVNRYLDKHYAMYSNCCSTVLGSPAHREISLVQNHPPCNSTVYQMSFDWVWLWHAQCGHIIRMQWYLTLTFTILFLYYSKHKREKKNERLQESSKNELNLERRKDK